MWSADKSSEGTGGFLDQSYAQSSNQQGTKSGPVRGNTVVPLMIGHLLDDKPDNLSLWGAPIKLITIVAYVKKFERLTTKVSYELVDETGTIIGYQWVENDSSPDLVTVPVGQYARVVGSPREQGDSRHIFILKIEHVTKLVDVFEHLLEVTFACLKGEELFGEPEPGKTTRVVEESINDVCHGMNKEQVTIFKLIRADNKSESGVDREELRTKVPGSLRDKLDAVLEFLVSEGHIYTTCNDDHFKTT